MPEIAEVRTVKSALKKNIIGKTIKDINIIYPNIIKTDLDEFKSILIGKTFKDITTIGKWLIFNLGDYSLVSHLRMEGKYYYRKNSDDIEKHEHIIFNLDNGYDLRYKDVRKFGVMILCKTNEVMNLVEIKKLGLEPDDNSLNEDYLYNLIHKSNKTIKELLLDQSIINGLGNIYVDEVLFASHILPMRCGNSISKEECKSIVNEASRIIKKATLCGGCTIRSYTSSLGVEGTYQNYLMVHTKEGENCKICGTKIKKTRVGGRGTYYCENCQK